MTCPNCEKLRKAITRIAEESLRDKDKLFELERELKKAVRLLKLFRNPDAVWNEEDEAKLVGFQEALEKKPKRKRT
jgi:hypothetical protein